MKNSDQLIEHILAIAVDNFNENVKPDAYAAKAAHVLAKAAAAEFSEVAADAAAFVAALDDIMQRAQFAQYSAQLADSAAKMNDAKKNYENKASAHPTLVILDLEEQTLSCEELLEPLNSALSALDARRLYYAKYAEQKTDQFRAALLAASTMYPHAYANARAAYIYAIGVAARYPEGQEQMKVFKTCMAERLNADIKCEPVSPSMFMQVMCSALIKFIALGLLIISVFALPLGVSGLMVASVAETLISIGINSMILTTTGAASFSVGGGLWACGFFTEKHWRADNEKTQKAIWLMNQTV